MRHDPRCPANHDEFVSCGAAVRRELENVVSIWFCRGSADGHHSFRRDDHDEQCWHFGCHRLLGDLIN